MAKKGVPAGGGGHVAPSLVAPAPPGLPAPGPALSITLMQLDAGTVLHRVHLDRYEPAQFNPGVAGNARFSPIRDERGQAIPTLYAGTTLDCALMETVFHDVPYSGSLKTLAKQKLESQMHSTVTLARPLQLVDLTSVSLRKLGVQRNQLIDTEKDQYPHTRCWAEALYRQCPDAQGLLWVSRQDDTARAVVLFGDRVGKGALAPTQATRSLLHDASIYSSVIGLAERLGLLLVD